LRFEIACGWCEVNFAYRPALIAQALDGSCFAALSCHEQTRAIFVGHVVEVELDDLRQAGGDGAGLEGFER
jgi:hypothetical protein